MKRKAMKYMYNSIAVFICVFTALPVFASQLQLIPLEEDIKNINTVLAVEVTGIKRESEYLKLADGTDGPMSLTSIIVIGEVRQVVWGKYERAEVITKYTWIVPIKYDETGKQVLSYSLTKSGSGSEDEVELGQEYLFSYQQIDETGGIQYHKRMDRIEDIDNIILLLKQ